MRLQYDGISSEEQVEILKKTIGVISTKRCDVPLPSRDSIYDESDRACEPNIDVECWLTRIGKEKPMTRVLQSHYSNNQIYSSVAHAFCGRPDHADQIR